MSEMKDQLIRDIETLLNRFPDVSATRINPDLLTFMDEASLRQIIGMLLDQQEKTVENNKDWLEQFKKYY